MTFDSLPRSSILMQHLIQMIGPLIHITDLNHIFNIQSKLVCVYLFWLIHSSMSPKRWCEYFHPKFWHLSIRILFLRVRVKGCNIEVFKCIIVKMACLERMSYWSFQKYYCESDIFRNSWYFGIRHLDARVILQSCQKVDNRSMY